MPSAQLPNIRSKYELGDRHDLPAANRYYNESLRQLNNDDVKSFHLNEEAAESGMHDAVLAMGWFYWNGVGVEANRDEAIRWYRKSARQGDERAMFSLGQIAYELRDFNDSLMWFTRAEQKGHARAKYWIGKLYWKGAGVELNRKKARQLFAEAASQKVEEAQRAIRYLAYCEKIHRSA